jgi:hypothetical protein
MAPPVVTSESCVFNKIGEGFWCPERFTLLDDMPCFGILRLVTTYYTYPEPTPCWSCPRPNGAPRFRCASCRRDFSPTSGTLFAFHKLEIRDYLAAIVFVCDEGKGKAVLALSRDLDVQYKTALVLAHKLREALAAELKGPRLGGAGRPSRSTAATSAATSGRRTGA